MKIIERKIGGTPRVLYLWTHMDRWVWVQAGAIQKTLD